MLTSQPVFPYLRPSSTAEFSESVMKQSSTTVAPKYQIMPGRMKKSSRWAFLWTLLAVLFAVLAGLSGSALVASMIALILSSIVVLRAALGGGAGFGFGFSAPSGFGYALPVGGTANGRITYDMNPEVYMDDNSESAAGAPLMYAAYARLSNPPVNMTRPFRPTE